MRKQWLLTLMGVLVGVLLSMASTVREAEGQAECPKLENRLLGLTQAANPEQYALLQGFYYEKEETTKGDSVVWVRLVIELHKANDSLPTGYALRFEGRYEHLVQLLSRVADLCALSNEVQVAYVRPPVGPLPDGSSQGK